MLLVYNCHEFLFDNVCVPILLPCTIVTLLRYDSIELKELLTYLLTYCHD